jgi:hypothetical protein
MKVGVGKQVPKRLSDKTSPAALPLLGVRSLVFESCGQIGVDFSLGLLLGCFGCGLTGSLGFQTLLEFLSSFGNLARKDSRL